MNFQQKEALIENAILGLKQGVAWNDFQEELRVDAGLYQRDIDLISMRVLLAVEKDHGPRIHAALRQHPATVRNEGLDPVLFEKIRLRQETAIRNKAVNDMARELRNGGDPDQVFARHEHPLVSRKDLWRAQRKNAKPVTDHSSGDFDAKLVLKLILLVIKLILGISAFS